MAGALQRLREHLLPRTLEHAVTFSPFYARHLGEAWREVASVEDLKKLPPLDKETAATHQREMRCGDAPADFGAVSSGTTRVGRRLFRVERSPDEAAALEDFLRMVEEAQQAEGDAASEDVAPPPPPPRVLQIITPNHGLPAAAPPANTMRLAWASSKNVMQMVEEALLDDEGGEQISVLRVSISALKQLTLLFLEQGCDFSRFGVRAIGTNAALVTSRWRRLIEQTWGARIYDNYSLSEFVTPATECEACGWYHFGEPPLILEVLDVVTGEPRTAGVGELCLTGLFPYVQRQPLIRYLTGDLVEIGPWCEAGDDVGVRFVGRVKDSLFREGADGRTRYLLSPPLLEDLLDELPEVARHRHALDKVERVTPYQVGTPKYQASLEGEELAITVGVLFQPKVFPERSAELVTRIEKGLLATHRDLEAELASGDLKLTIALEPGFDDDGERWTVKYLM